MQIRFLYCDRRLSLVNNSNKILYRDERLKRLNRRLENGGLLQKVEGGYRAWWRGWEILISSDGFWMEWYIVDSSPLWLIRRRIESSVMSDVYQARDSLSSALCVVYVCMCVCMCAWVCVYRKRTERLFFDLRSLTTRLFHLIFPEIFSYN